MTAIGALEVGGLAVQIQVDKGFARLEISDGLQLCKLRATTWDLKDPVSELAASLVALASGAADTSARWADEPGGSFLDFDRPRLDEIALVVHAFADIRWLGNPDWLPRRGQSLFGIRLSRAAMLRAFSDAYARLQGSETAEMYEHRWGHPFPVDLVTELSAAL